MYVKTHVELPNRTRLNSDLGSCDGLRDLEGGRVNDLDRASGKWLSRELRRFESVIKRGGACRALRRYRAFRQGLWIDMQCSE